MKILKESQADKKWWSGVALECGCGFKAEIEEADSDDHKNFNWGGNYFDFQCKCGRAQTVFQDGEVMN
jgi:hypothetical protein